jgi:hypothetical protein
MRTQDETRPETQAGAIDEARVEQLMEQALANMSGLSWFLLTAIGLRTGLWTALAGAGPVTPQDAAKRAGLAEPYVREWLKGQAAAGFVDYDAGAGTFALSDEVAFLLSDPASPGHLGGFVDVGLAFNQDWPAVAADIAFGRGVGGAEHTPH